MILDVIQCENHLASIQTDWRGSRITCVSVTEKLLIFPPNSMVVKIFSVAKHL
jgi:hypothetical protein